MTARAVVVLACLGGVAAADPVALPKTKAVLDVPTGWTKLADPSLVIAYKGPAGMILAVTRAAVPNASAWIPASRAAYVAEVERGAIAAVPGQRKLTSRTTLANGIPAFDLELRRADGSTIVTRILLFRTYALAATIEIPKGGALEPARAITSQFSPPR